MTQRRGRLHKVWAQAHVDGRLLCEGELETVVAEPVARHDDSLSVGPHARRRCSRDSMA
jgi:hypothetical protein